MEFLNNLLEKLRGSEVDVEEERGVLHIANRLDNRLSIEVSILHDEATVAIGEIYHRHYCLDSEDAAEDAHAFIMKILRDTCYFTIVKSGDRIVSSMCKDLEDGSVSPIFFLKSEEKEGASEWLKLGPEKDVEEDLVWSCRSISMPIPSLGGDYKELVDATSQITAEEVVSLIESMEKGFGCGRDDGHNK